MNRPLHRVSAKIALFNTEHTKVLITRMERGVDGLPGGHVERGETPEQAVIREVQEELGFIYTGALRQQRFWRGTGDDDRILLGYTGTVDENTPFVLQQEEIQSVYWATYEQVRSGYVRSSTYKDYLLEVFQRAK